MSGRTRRDIPILPDDELVEDEELLRARLGLDDPEDDRYDPRSEWFDDGTGQVQQ